jgi:hypothetical protein
MLAAAICIGVVTRHAPADEPDAPVLPANATPLNTLQQTEQFVGAFLKMLSAGSTADAFAMMKAASPRDAANDIDETRDSTQQLLDSSAPSMGKPVGFELLARRQVGQSLIRFECLLKLERHPLRCTIFFYKPAEIWTPMQVTFDSDMHRLFDDMTQP